MSTSPAFCVDITALGYFILYRVYFEDITESNEIMNLQAGKTAFSASLNSSIDYSTVSCGIL